MQWPYPVLLAMPSQDDAGDANNNQEAEKWPKVSVDGGVKTLVGGSVCFKHRKNCECCPVSQLIVR